MDCIDWYQDDYKLINYWSTKKIEILGWHHLNGEQAIIAALNEYSITASVKVYPFLRGLHQGKTVGRMRFHIGFWVQTIIHVMHSLLLMGYGVDAEGTPYYIGKGCWGVDRWMNDYIRVLRDVLSYFIDIEGNVYWRPLVEAN
ncbi:hypothetical protein RND71_013112 [Anisodus tanguticus]|uniref:Peptidase C1A papain C-terminal domain-containing protein n=1 Tax=Anisodus tanguticus TaxID=243964 RepID=A0AAE1SGH0_9SOLA|nr:hypothetical protein RND71_013112 [Anisodus tanguticus]